MIVSVTYLALKDTNLSKHRGIIAMNCHLSSSMTYIDYTFLVVCQTLRESFPWYMIIAVVLFLNSIITWNLFCGMQYMSYSRHIGILLPILIFASDRHRCVILHQCAKFCQNRHHRKFYQKCDFSHTDPRTAKYVCIPSMTQIYSLTVKNKSKMTAAAIVNFQKAILSVR